jgi:hypothetical protein
MEVMFVTINPSPLKKDTLRTTAHLTLGHGLLNCKDDNIETDDIAESGSSMDYTKPLVKKNPLKALDQQKSFQALASRDSDMFHRGVPHTCKPWNSPSRLKHNPEKARGQIKSPAFNRLARGHIFMVRRQAEMKGPWLFG